MGDIVHRTVQTAVLGGFCATGQSGRILRGKRPVSCRLPTVFGRKAPAILGVAPGSAIPDRLLPPSPSLGRSSSLRPSRSASPRFAAWHAASPACGWPFASTPSWNARWPRGAGKTIRAASRREVCHPAVAGCRVWLRRPVQGYNGQNLDSIGSKPDHGKRPVRAVRSAVARMTRQPQPQERNNDRSLVSGVA
jgi:hypothetical protein